MGLHMTEMEPIEYDGKYYVYRVTERQTEGINLSLEIYSDKGCEDLIEEQELNIPFLCRDTLAELIKRG